MKRKMSVAMSLLMASAMLLSLFGCFGPKDVNQNMVNAEFDEYLATVKVGSVERDDFFTAEGGLYYKENDKYGIMSPVGLHDTGAIYSYMSEKDGYFAVSKKVINDSTKVNDLNSLSLIDGYGHVIASGYACYELVDTRYAVAYTVTGRCYLEDDALICYKDGIIYSSPSSDRNMYEGTWCLYDLKTGKKVPGISGNKHPSILGYGDLFSLKAEDGSWVKYDANGKAVQGKFFDDGSYAKEEKIGTMYKADGTKLFDYDLTGYCPVYISSDRQYYVASMYKDGDTTYVVMNKEGEVISSEFPSIDTMEGDLLICEDKVYNFSGENIISGVYDDLDKDAMFGNVWMLRKDQTYTIINETGAVFYNGTDNDACNVFSDYFTASMDKEGERYVYSYKDQDYTIKARSFAPWLVIADSTNNLKNLVDTMTGKTILEGYNSYSYNAYTSYAYYVYAKYNGGADVYLVVSGSQLDEVEQMKEDLLNDLVAAFENEGIDVSIDKDTGAMSLGSDILFQPDKAELTAQGKSDLTKFLNAYAKVAFSEKYAGFINKTIIEGHIAPDGDSYASGMALSEERADVVLKHCLSVGKGDVVNSIQAIGYSNSQPIYNEDGSVNMEKSRRVSFRFMMNIEF